jgi:class 3 adenylate cyclase/tetratricopeptide (TPR) repeat protein/type II secretory pathway predicted ATPase ExeA
MQSAETRRAERIHATVVFADIVGFTTALEKLGAERAYFILTGCLKLLGGIARKHGGAVDPYFGDALLAVFGYPVPLEGAERAACDAVVEMRRCVLDYNRQLALEVPLNVRIGVNTGRMVAGDIRGSAIREFHVLGDAVNSAARLKAKAPMGSIYVGPQTHAATAERFEYRPLEPLALKGKEERVAAYELIASRKSAGSSEMRFSEMIGRDHELARLGRSLERLASGEGGVEFVVGEEGSGKSRLLAELLEASVPDSVVMLRAHGSFLAREQRLHLFSSLHSDLEGVEPAAAASWLRERAASGPLLLVLEDLQWADERSLDLLEQLLGAMASGPVLLLFSLRADPDEAPHRTLAFAREHCTALLDEIRLGPLDETSSQRLIDRLVTGDEPPATRSLIAQRAAGNPARLIMGSFLAPALRAESRQEAERERSSEAERRRVTILFADITGFTAMTEKLGPERAYPIVAGALQILDEIASKHGGTVDKYLGDCVMALFGVPEAIENAPQAAVNAAIEMRERIHAYNRESQLALPLDVHSGIHTGLGIAGDISGHLIREFAVMGDPVNIADQLKDLAPAGAIYVGSETHRLTRGVFEYREAEPVRLAERPQETPSFELLSRETRLHRARIGAERQVFSTLVGRDQELEQLKDRVRRLDQGEGSIVSLIAQAGIGKSRLVAELRTWAGDRGVTWLEGRSLSTGQQLSFHPFADLCRAWARIEDSDDEDRAREKLESLVGELPPEEAADAFLFLGAILGMRHDLAREQRLEHIHGDALEKMIRHSVTELLRKSSKRRSLLVVMDDFHWADLSSVALLESLLLLAVEQPILFLNVARPGFPESSGHISHLADERYGERHLAIRLEPLKSEATREMINNLFKQGDLPHALRTLIGEKAQGNPFYIEEVVRSLVDEGAVEHRDGSFRATEKIHAIEIPGTVQEVIMSRVDRLNPERKSLLQVAAVIGQSFHCEVLREIVGPGEELERNLQELHDAEFIVPWDRLQGTEYAFKHPLIQEVTYDGILQTKREELHRTVAGAIEKSLPEDLPGYFGMLAYHLSMGRDVEHAEKFLFRAGDEAAKLAATSEALHFFREALKLYVELHGKAADPAKMALLEKNIARALFNRGQLIEAEEHINLALECLGEKVPKGDRALLRRFLLDILAVMAHLYLPIGRRQKPFATETQREVAILMFERGQCAITADPQRFVFDSMGLVRRVLRVDPHTVSGSGMMLAASSGIFSFGAGAFGTSRRLLTLAEPLVEEDDLQAYFHYRTASMVHHMYEGDWSPEHEVPPSLIEQALSYGQLWDVLTYLANHGDQLIAMGRFEEARWEMELKRKIRDQYENGLAKSGYRYLTTLLALEERRLEDALEEAQLHYEENPEELLHIHALAGRAKAQILLGDRSGAAETLDLCVKIIEKLGRLTIPPFMLSNYQRSRFLLDVADLEDAVARGDGSRGRVLARQAGRSGAAALRLARKVATRKTEVLRALGRYHWLAARPKKAWAWWGQALAEGRRLGARPETARSSASRENWKRSSGCRRK